MHHTGAILDAKFTTLSNLQALRFLRHGRRGFMKLEKENLAEKRQYNMR